MLAVMYAITGLGVTLGFHRLLTHRSFQTLQVGRVRCSRSFGSMSVQGPVMSWVADHRKHHAHTDQEGDPHSPHGHGSGLQGRDHRASGTRTWAGCSTAPARRSTCATPATSTRIAACASSTSTFLVWVLAGLLLPVADRLRDRRHAGARFVIGGALGRRRADLPAAPPHLVDQLRLPLLRHAPLRPRRSLDQRLLARPVHVRRGLAPQPPRVPALGHARAQEVGDRPDRLRDPRHAARSSSHGTWSRSRRSARRRRKPLGRCRRRLGRAARDPARVVGSGTPPCRAATRTHKPAQTRRSVL